MQNISLWAVLLSGFLAGGAMADETPGKTQYLSAEQLASMVAQTSDGMVLKEIPSGPGSQLLIVRRDKSGEAEIHLALNDIIVIQAGHGTMTVGGEVKGNREIRPTEWRGGPLSGAPDYALKPGDVLYIPAGVPHQVTLPPRGSIRYLTVKTPKALAP